MAEYTNVIIDDDLILDTTRDMIVSKSQITITNQFSFPTAEINEQLDKIDDAIADLESSLDPRTTSRLSYKNREGIYIKEAMLTNIILGVIIALVFIILIL